MAQDIVMWTFMGGSLLTCLLALFLTNLAGGFINVLMFRVLPFITFVMGGIISFDMFGVL